MRHVTGPHCTVSPAQHAASPLLQGSQWVRTERPATDADPVPSRLGWQPEPGARTNPDAGPPRARLLSSQQQPASEGSGHAAVAGGTVAGVAQGVNRSAMPATAGTAAASAGSDKQLSSDAAAKPNEPDAAQGSTSGSEAAKEKHISGEGEHPIAVAPASTAAGPTSKSAAKDAQSQGPDSSSIEQGDGSEPDNSKPDAKPAGPALAQRSSGDGGDGERSGAAHGSQRPEEAEIARGAARQGARQPDPRTASGGKPRKPKGPKHRKAPKDRSAAVKVSDSAVKSQDAQPASPAPDTRQTAAQQVRSQDEAQPAAPEAGVPDGDQAAVSQQTDQPTAEEDAAPAQQSQPAPAVQKKSAWSRYPSHDPGADREGTWSSFRALPNMHEAHPHYHECAPPAHITAAAPKLRVFPNDMLQRT